MLYTRYRLADKTDFQQTVIDFVMSLILMLSGSIVA